MLEIHVPKREWFDERTETFVTSDEITLKLEHSLASLSKWESKWHKAFLSKTETRTAEEMLDYIRCMSLEPIEDIEVLKRLPFDVVKQIKDYIDDPMTATWFSNENRGTPSRETVTAELVYYWMISCQIPFECQYWHFNKLLTLIRVCDIKNSPPKKMGKKALAKRNTALNQARKKQLNTRG